MSSGNHPFKRVHLAALLLALCLVFSGCEDRRGPAAEESPVLPDLLVSLRSNVTLMASNEASALAESTFAVTYRNLLYSGQGTTYKDYEALTETVQELRKRCNAYQVYLLSDLDDDLASLEVTVASQTAGTAEPCRWADHHKAEYALLKAYNGTAAGDMFARQWDDGALTWTAYAPLRDSNGTVIGILAVEYPYPALADYPEWNRMSAQWNGIVEPSESN